MEYNEIIRLGRFSPPHFKEKIAELSSVAVGQVTEYIESSLAKNYSQDLLTQKKAQGATLLDLQATLYNRTMTQFVECEVEYHVSCLRFAVGAIEKILSNMDMPIKGFAQSQELLMKYYQSAFRQQIEDNLVNGLYDSGEVMPLSSWSRPIIEMLEGLPPMTKIIVVVIVSAGIQIICHSLGRGELGNCIVGYLANAISTESARNPEKAPSMITSGASVAMRFICNNGPPSETIKAEIPAPTHNYAKPPAPAAASDDLFFD